MGDANVLQEIIDLNMALLPDFVDDPVCLIELAADISKNQTLLKLFLEGPSEVDRHELEQMSPIAVREFFDNLTLPAGYFPQTFKIIDTCFTNAGFVWFHKHFYL